ncbi:MAG: hypothetical protein HKN09_06995 [Saprospiraceae bacterium]|nr:hypothetical protein [Saprospiraceae bacterium]
MNAHLEWEDATNGDYLISIPFIKNEFVTGIILIIKQNGNSSYYFFTKALFDLGYTELIEQLTPTLSALVIGSFFVHQKHHHPENQIYYSAYLKKLIEEIENQKNHQFCYVEYWFDLHTGEIIHYNILSCHGTGPTSIDDHEEVNGGGPLTAPETEGQHGVVLTVDEDLCLPNLSETQHEVMAKKYVDKIAKSLREFDNSSYPIEYYKYIAWSGLEEYGAQLGFVSEYLTEFSSYHETVINNYDSSCL